MKLQKRFFIYPAVASVLLATGAARSVEPPEHDKDHAPKPQVIESQPRKPEAGARPSPERTKVELPPQLPAAKQQIAKASAKDPAAAQRAEDALAQLKEGNERWIANNTNHPNTSTQRRQEVVESGQHPIATVFTCADSRLPVERIFDRGVGDIFVVRVAGNVIGNMETGTIEYGVEHLKTPLLIVMGHTKCGAVAAAASKGEVHGKIADIVTTIKPAVDRAARNNPRATPEDLARIAVKENVWQSIFDLLKNSDVCRDKLAAGQVRIIGAVCDVSTGKIEWMGEHPWQSELVDAMEARAANTAHADDK